MEGFVAINDDHWPLVITVHNGQVGTEAMDRYYESVDIYLARNERYCALTDIANVVTPTREMRKHEAERMKTYEPMIKKGVFASAMVVPSPVIRIVLNSIFFMHRPGIPYQITATPEESWHWLQKRFEEMGQEIPVSCEKCTEIVLSLRQFEL